MAPFRPTNLNKRAYPGNAGVVGPTTQATVGYTTTTCCACISTLCGAANISWTLGCRCQPASYPCCNCCCCCVCTVCTRSIPSGRYKSFEQYEARTCRDAWSASSCSNAAAIGFCASPGTITGCTIDCKGFYVVQSGSRYLVAPSCTQQAVAPVNYSNVSNFASQCMGALGWYIGSMSEVCITLNQNKGYWDSYTTDPSRDDNHVSNQFWGSPWGPSPHDGVNVTYPQGWGYVVQSKAPGAQFHSVRPDLAACGNYHVWGRAIRTV